MKHKFKINGEYGVVGEAYNGPLSFNPQALLRSAGFRKNIHTRKVLVSDKKMENNFIFQLKEHDDDNRNVYAVVKGYEIFFCRKGLIEIFGKLPKKLYVKVL